MPRYVHEGNTKVTWTLAIADIAEPTVAELNAGVDISTYVPVDGVKPSQNQTNVDSKAITDRFDAQVVGSWGGEFGMTFFRDDTDDDAWELCEYGTNGFLVVRRGVDWEDAWAAADKVEVYPAEMHQPIPVETAGNAQDRFTEKFAITSTPDLKAVVAAT